MATYRVSYRLACALILLCASAIQAASQDRVLATINGKPITEEDARAAVLELGAEFSAVPAENRDRVLMDFLIDKQLFSEAGEKAGLDRSPKYEAQMRYARRSALRDQYVASNVKVTEADARKLYDQQARQAKPEEEIRARHILVDSLAEAKNLREQVLKGEAFAALAQRFSKDTGSNWNGGDLGFFVRGQMDDEFEAAVATLRPGMVSEPVKSKFGWHLILVEQKRARTVPPFDSVKAEIMTQLIHRRLQELASGLRSGAKIDIADAALAQSLGVTRPEPRPASGDGGPVVYAALSRQLEYAVTSEQLNLRSAPDPSAEVLAKLDFGSSGILALGDFKDHEDERWIKVKVAGNVGWVNDRYVKPTTPVNFVIDDKPGFELDGDSFRSPNASSNQECTKACLIDDRCKAMEFNRSSKTCNLFKTIPEAVRNKDVDAGIKRASAP